MTAAEFAQLLGARRVGKGKFIAKCPAHKDRKPSLSIAEGRRVPVLLKCMSQGCSTESILSALGLDWAALFDGKPTPEIRRRLTWEDRKASLERQLGLVIVLGATEKSKQHYWAAAERRICGEIDEVRCWIEPEKVIQEWQARQFQVRVAKVGWDQVWRDYGVERAGEGSAATESEVRP